MRLHPSSNLDWPWHPLLRKTLTREDEKDWRVCPAAPLRQALGLRTRNVGWQEEWVGAEGV